MSPITLKSQKNLKKRIIKEQISPYSYLFINKIFLFFYCNLFFISIKCVANEEIIHIFSKLVHIFFGLINLSKLQYMMDLSSLRF